MTAWTYKKGLHDLGSGCFAYLQPDGGWGWSNAGLITSRGQTLLVDTLYDLPLTREMLATMRKAVPDAANIGTLVNSHSNGDHTYGNQLVEGARIVASKRCYDEMAAQSIEDRRAELRNWRNLGDAGRFLHENAEGKFDYEGIVITLPTQTFERQLDLKVGDKDVKLIEVGPAHTAGDILIHVPGDRMVYTGDILFVDGHPPAWTGPISNWIKACDLISSWDVDVLVPGHGPIVEKAALKDFRYYFEYLTREVRRRFDAGLSISESAHDIDLTPFKGWIDSERIVVNVNTLYRDFGGKDLLSSIEIRNWMGRYRTLHRDDDHAHHHHGHDHSHKD